MMSLQYCSTILRLFVVCVGASIFVLFLSLQHPHSPLLKTQQQLPHDLQGRGGLISQENSPGRSYSSLTSSSVGTNTLLQYQSLIDNKPMDHQDQYDSYEEAIVMNSKNVPLHVNKQNQMSRIESKEIQHTSSGNQHFNPHSIPSSGVTSIQRDMASFENDDGDQLSSTNERKRQPDKVTSVVQQSSEKLAESSNTEVIVTDRDNVNGIHQAPNITGGTSRTTSTTTQTLDKVSYSQNRTRVFPSSFVLDSSFQLPWHRSKSVTSIMQQVWYSSLVDFLQKSTPKLPIVLVAADENFKPALLNWLIFSLALQANPIKNLLVLTYHSSICSLINQRQLTDCLLVPPSTLTAPDLYENRKYGGLYPLLVVRVVVMRVLNRLGYDVANFDSDAILLRNPIPVFEEYPESDVIGTFGGGLPGHLLQKWGVVVCMGAIFMRSTRSTEALWDAVKEYRSGDDQIKMNYGIDAMGIKWTTKNLNQSNSSDSLSVLWRAKGKDNLTLTLLPQRIACRQMGCTQEVKGQCYIWHHGKNKHKFKNMSGKAKNDGLWRLRRDWVTVDENSTNTGVAWLKEMMTK